jgi:uncharacterized protein (TIGR02466 family)
MLWISKKQTISKIPRDVEIALLKRAYLKHPGKAIILEKLVQALIYQNAYSEAIQLCREHIKRIPADRSALLLLLHLLSEKGDIGSVINLSEAFLDHTQSIDVSIRLAYAYSQNKQYDNAKNILIDEIDYSTTEINNLRLVLRTLLNSDAPQVAGELYRSLSKDKQIDSGLRASYIKVLEQLGDSIEIARLTDYQGLVKNYQLAELTSDIDFLTLNKQLEEFLLSHPGQQYEPGVHTTRYGTQIHLEADWNPALITIEQNIKHAVEHFSRINAIQTLLQLKSATVSFNLWATVLTRQGHQTSHIHPDALVSGVYYVSVPESIRTSSQPSQGWLCFSQSDAKPKHYIKPTEGVVTLFPSYLYHETLPLEYAETRICIAFDICKV